MTPRNKAKQHAVAPPDSLTLAAVCGVMHTQHEKYTEDDIKVLNWEELARNRPEMYFGAEGPSAMKIAEAIDYVAKTLGAKNTTIREIDE